MYFEEFCLGQTADIAPVSIDKAAMMDFAVKYDNVPLHTDEEYAASTCFGQIISPGIYTYAVVWAKYLEHNMFGEQLLAGISTKIEWSAPVFAGDTVWGKAEITDIRERNAKNGFVEMTIKAYNQDNALVMTVTAQAIVMKRQ